MVLWALSVPEQDYIFQEVRLAIDKWYFIKIKGFWTAKEPIRIVKKKPTESGRESLPATNLTEN